MRRNRYVIQSFEYADRPKIYKRYGIYDREYHYLILIGEIWGTARKVCDALNNSEDTIRSLESILRQAKVRVSLRKPEEVY